MRIELPESIEGDGENRELLDRYNSQYRKFVMMSRRIDYDLYLQSIYWSRFRRAILKYRSVCERCGGKDDLCIHHKHYKSRGQESPEDVEVLCEPCHRQEHGLSRRNSNFEAGEVQNE